MDFPDFMEHLRKPGIVLIPLAQKVYLKEFGTPEYQRIAERMETLREEYDESEKGDEIVGEYDKLFNQLYSICEDAPVEKLEIEYDAVYNAALEAHMLLLHLDESSQADAFAIIESYKPDTYIKLICSSNPGMGALLLKKIERIAKDNGDKNITADAISDGLVAYYEKQGFKKLPQIPQGYTGVVKDNFVIKTLSGGKRKKTRRRLNRSLRVLNHKVVR
jgi:hypothetical protein